MRQQYYTSRKWFLILAAIPLALILFLLAKRRAAAKRASEPLRILVIPQLTRIGDLVCATPVFRAIKARYPQSHVSVLISRRIEGIIRHNSDVDEVVPFSSSGFSRMLRAVRRERFDWGICLSGAAIGMLVSMFGLIPQRVTLSWEPRKFSKLLTDWMATHRFPYAHHTFLPGHYVKMLEPLGIRGARVEKRVVPSAEGDAHLAEFSRAHGVAAADLLVGMSVGAGNKIKEWGDDRFRALGEAIAKRYGAKIVYIGSPGDTERIKKLRDGLDPNRFLQVTDFPLDHIPSLVKRLNLYIAADTGLIYVAHALGTPLIDIIGPVDPREQPPKDEQSIQVLPPPPIQPSSFVFKTPGPPEAHRRAIQSISVEMALQAVQEMFEERLRFR